MDFKQTHVEHDHKHGSPLLCCGFAASPEMVYFGAEDYSVWSWNWSTDQKVQFPTQAWVRSIVPLPDGQSLVTGGYDGRLTWWPTAGDPPKAIRSIDAHDGWIRAVALSPDAATLASVGNDLVVRIWNARDGSLVKELSGQPPSEAALRHDSYIYNVAFHPDGASLVTGDLMGQLIHWNLESGQPQRTWSAESLSKYDTTFRAQIGGFRSMVFNADGSKLYASGITKVTNAFAGVGDPSVVEFDWAEAKQAIEYVSKPTLRGVAWGAEVLPDGSIAAAHGGSGGNLIFWNAGTAEAAHQLKLPQNARDLDLHSDGLRLAVAGSDGRLHVCLMDVRAAES
jgi:WD40 repeat protein